MKYSVTKKDIPNVSEFMTLFWQMIKDFYNGDNSLEYWEAVMERGRRIVNKTEAELGKYLVNAFLDFEDKKVGDGRGHSNAG